jgi:hypothetical protein
MSGESVIFHIPSVGLLHFVNVEPLLGAYITVD